MDARTLVSPETLDAALGQPGLVVVDCRFDLNDARAGEEAYLAGHVPGAIYAHLDRELADRSKHGRGRHPLPDAAELCARLGRWGISTDSQVVIYDGGDGAHAARLWWMLRLLGHRRAAVLDGGYVAWLGAGGRAEQRVPRPRKAVYSARYDVRQIVTMAVVAARMAVVGSRLIDARAPERFRGEVEPIDAVAGHIPGAINRHYGLNINGAGRFKSADQLAEEFNVLLAGARPADVIHMCGSGVTACHNLLAMEHAGLTGSRVYAGSWSEWISDRPRSRERARPVARGAA
jgi:thiosulfate/3-mercaptopyruvate sulfurtransferase